MAMICWMVIVVQGMKIQYGVLDDSDCCIGMVLCYTNGNAAHGYATNQNIKCFESNDRDEYTRRRLDCFEYQCGVRVVFQQALYEQTIHGLPL